MILDREVYFSNPIIKRLTLFSRKFFYILFRFLGRPTWGRLKAGGKTPYEKQSLVLTVNEEGSLRCTSCQLCVDICPTQCLNVSLGPNDSFPSSPAFFQFEPLKCITCNLCEDVCPESAIAFVPAGRAAGHFEEDWQKDLHYLAYRGELNKGQGLTPDDVLNLRKARQGAKEVAR